jgi:hypothetical protein
MSATFSLMCSMLIIEFRGRPGLTEAAGTFLFTDCVSAASIRACFLWASSCDGPLVWGSPRPRISIDLLYNDVHVSFAVGKTAEKS